MGELDRLCLAPVPDTFRLWYTHLAGENPAMSRMISALLEGGEVIDEVRCAELHDRFFLQDRDEAQLVRTHQRLHGLTAELGREVGTFQADAARYGTSLSEAQASVAAAPQSERIRAIVNGIIEETARIQGRAQRIEARLRSSMTEMDTLRRDLQAAWTEARTDGLTGLANRRYFDAALKAATAQVAGRGGCACLLLADVDHFKKFNDEHGHPMGDQVLRLVAAMLRENVRRQDFVARFGGEEFALILPDAGLTEAFAIANRLRELVASRQVQLKDRVQSLGRVTLSIGLTECCPGERCADWLGRADGALYEAKRAGRNRVIAKPAEAHASLRRRAEPLPLGKQG